MHYLQFILSSTGFVTTISIVYPTLPPVDYAGSALNEPLEFARWPALDVAMSTLGQNVASLIPQVQVAWADYEGKYPPNLAAKVQHIRSQMPLVQLAASGKLAFFKAKKGIYNHSRPDQWTPFVDIPGEQQRMDTSEDENIDEVAGNENTDDGASITGNGGGIASLERRYSNMDVLHEA